MNAIIELHDSEVKSLLFSKGHLVLSLDPAMIHRSEGTPGVDGGIVETQAVLLRFADPLVDGILAELPGDIHRGSLIVNGTRYDNEIPLPFVEDGPVELRLTFSATGTECVLLGTNLEVALAGEPTYLEDFGPARWARTAPE